MATGKNKSSNSSLGKSLAKERKREKKGDGWLHTSELTDGYEWGRLNLRSVTEESSLDEFLRTAELAGTEFTAEKQNISVIHERYTGLPDTHESKEIKQAQELFQQDLTIPRRPLWDESTTVEQLELNERDAFLKWRRHLATLEERDKILLTPFEKNLEFWRQLWRVIERSDIIVQIVDARNPLLFRCQDLERYVNEISSEKINLLLMNKSDLLTTEQRLTWFEYFQSHNVQVAFWSAKINEESEESEEESVDASDILTCGQLLQLFKSLHSSVGKPITVGLVGYPNVGKSSTINTLFQSKKVPVSATPGRTKHFQTLYISDDIILCDCPGLVFPNFISTKAEMICNGILPIDQMRDHVPPVSMVCERIPRTVLEHYYGINIALPLEGENPARPPLSHELLSAYGLSRGFMTAHGQPDQSRSARYILKDYVNGKLLYCEPPPGIDPNTFNISLTTTQPIVSTPTSEIKEHDIIKTDTPLFDDKFFKQSMGVVHKKPPVAGGVKQDEVGGAKPWKKHHNYKKKEKTRRKIGDETPYNYF